MLRGARNRPSEFHAMSNRRSAAHLQQTGVMRHVLGDHGSHPVLDDSAGHISACLAPVSSPACRIIGSCQAPMFHVRIISENPSGPVATQSSAVATAFAARTSSVVWLLTQIVVLPARPLSAPQDGPEPPSNPFTSDKASSADFLTTPSMLRPDGHHAGHPHPRRLTGGFLKLAGSSPRDGPPPTNRGDHHVAATESTFAAHCLA